MSMKKRSRRLDTRGKAMDGDVLVYKNRSSQMFDLADTSNAGANRNVSPKQKKLMTIYESNQTSLYFFSGGGLKHKTKVRTNETKHNIHAHSGVDFGQRVSHALGTLHQVNMTCVHRLHL